MKQILTIVPFFNFQNECFRFIYLNLKRYKKIYQIKYSSTFLFYFTANFPDLVFISPLSLLAFLVYPLSLLRPTAVRDNCFFCYTQNVIQTHHNEGLLGELLPISFVRHWIIQSQHHKFIKQQLVGGQSKTNRYQEEKNLQNSGKKF